VVKLLLAALIFLGLAFVGLLWLVCILANISLWVPGGFTAMIVVAGLGYVVVRALLAQRAAQGLQSALTAQAKEQGRVSRPDAQFEVERMRQEFDNAVGSLKHSNLGRKGRDALYFLPWYTIIGPPGAGKSTALRESGLRFPHVSETGDNSVKGLGGTRNCDWWLTNEAVILDTAGRWSTQEEDHDEWLAFLGLLKKHRPKKPLNGLICAISVGDVANGSAEEVEALARRMRERIDEVIKELRVSLPVYVLFTKCDLVEGFTDMFGDLSRADRGQVWGFTAPLAEKNLKPALFFDDAFEQITRVLDKRTLARMPEERGADARARIYAFPQQFATMRRNLVSFTSVLFESSVYQQPPTMRGVYFTSGTQEGRPFSLLLNRLAGALGVQDRVDQPVAVDHKSYFLHDVFMNVIFEDRDVASASDVELRRQGHRRLAVTALLGLVALCVGVVPSYAWLLNSRELSAAVGMVDSWEALQAQPQPAGATTQAPGAKAARESKDPKDSVLVRLRPLLDVTDRLGVRATAGAPTSMGFGMYQGDTLLPALRRYYANLVRRELVQRVMAEDVQSMTDFGFRYESLAHARPTAEEQEVFYDLLKLHLLLTAPRAEVEPGLGPEQQKWVTGQLARKWLAGQATPSTELVRLAQTNADLYTRFAAERAELAFARDKDVIKRVRMALNRVPSTERALDRIVRTVDPDGFDLDVDALVGSMAGLTATKRVRGAYTRRGWEGRVRDLLSTDMLDNAGELWVLGTAEDSQGAAAQAEDQLTALSTAYFRAYIQEWQEFLVSLRLQRPTNDDEVLELLRNLTRGQPPPIALLLHRLHYNVQLEPKPEPVGEKLKETAVATIQKTLGGLLGNAGKQAGAAVQKGLDDRRKLGTEQLGPTDVAKAFEGLTDFAVPPKVEGQAAVPSTPYDAYHEQLYAVKDALQTRRDDPAQAGELTEKLQEARTRARSIIDEQQVGWRPLFDALLWPPIDAAAASSSMALASSTAGAYCNEIVAPFDAKLRAAYPFNSAGQDLALDDLAEFYKAKEGLVWKFVETTLGRTVEQDGGRFSYSTKLGRDASSVFSLELLDFLERSHDVTASFFPDGAAPEVKFEVRIHPSPWVATTTFTVGGKGIEYHNGPEKWEPLQWPGEQPEAGATLVVRGANGMFERVAQEGEWGLFRLLEAGSIVHSAQRTFTVAWELQTHNVTIKADIRARNTSSPFFGVEGREARPAFLQSVRTKGVMPPSKIVVEGKACRKP
jgi:type VI secretion system protein ImpL